MKSVIVGTAGHIDHGKTALVKALTGIDADRLEEEKRRGITIDLGFAHMELPGPDATPLRLGFVDVPGHERFVRNMLAGVGGIDLVLFVIAADEGIKPQTREHFDICPDHVGAPLREALMLVHNTLVGVNLRQRIRIGASAKIITAFDCVRTMAIGADWCNSARGFMFALGCIQAQTCHTGRCPTGVATQDPGRMQALVSTEKATRVVNFHQSTLKAVRELLGTAGLSHTSELGPEHIVRRISSTEVRTLARLHSWVKPGEILEDLPAQPAFAVYWNAARADSFAAPKAALAVPSMKTR